MLCQLAVVTLQTPMQTAERTQYCGDIICELYIISILILLQCVFFQVSLHYFNILSVFLSLMSSVKVILGGHSHIQYGSWKFNSTLEFLYNSKISNGS